MSGIYGNRTTKKDKHKQPILDLLGVAGITQLYEAIGFKPKSQSGDWVNGSAIGRADKKSSAGFNVKTGVYKDFAGDTINIFRAMHLHGGYSNYQSARLAAAKLCNYTKLSDAGKNGAMVGIKEEDQERATSKFLEAKKGISRRAFNENGCGVAIRYGKSGKTSTVVVVPSVNGYGADVGYSMYIVPYGNSTKWALMSDVDRESSDGWLGSDGVRNFSTAEIIFKVEGSTDMLALWSLIDDHKKYAVVSTLNGCKQRPGAEQLRTLHGKNVVIIGDNDEPGQLGAEMWVDAIASTVKSVKNVKLCDIEGADVRDWIDVGGTFENLMAMVDITAPADRKLHKKHFDMTLGLNSHETVHKVRKHMIFSNDPPDLFSYGGKLCYVSNGQVHQHTKWTLTHAVSKHTEFYVDSGDDRVIKEPPVSIVNGLLDYDGSVGFPSLHGLTALPIVRQDGTLVNGSGYDEKSGRLHVGNITCEPGNNPTHGDALKSLDLFRDLIKESTFANEASEANAIAMLLTSILYSYFASADLIDAPAPMFIINASQSGTGKSELAKLACMLGFGSSDPMILAGRDEDVQKQIVTELATGKGYMFFDNLDRGRKTNSNAIAVAATTKTLTGRGAYMKQVTVKTDALWVLTGNHIQIADDFQRRMILITMSSPTANPGDYKREREGVFMAWASSRRGIYAAAAINWLRSWIAAGKPSGATGGALLGYSNWSQAIAGMLTYVGVDGFDANRAEIAASDLEEGDWLTLFNMWYETYQHRESCEIKIGELFDADGVVEMIDSDDGLDLPEELVKTYQRGQSFSNAARALGRVLGMKFKDRVISVGGGEKQVRIKKRKTGGNHANYWMLEEVKSDANR